MTDLARSIRLLAMDVDGVLTNGSIIYTDSGEEIKAFNILDGLGIAVAGRAGLQTAIITGRSSAAIERRAGELGITHLIQGCRNKGAAMRGLLSETGLTLEEAAFIGDDINDIPAFRECGLRICVKNASDDLRALANFTTRKRGGQGAVREAIEMILKSQGKWDEAVERFLQDLEQSECRT